MTTQNHSNVAKHDAEQSQLDPTERRKLETEQAELGQVPVFIVGGKIGQTYAEQRAEADRQEK